MQHHGHRTAIYTRRHWACGGCGRTGLILVHCDDTPEKQVWRRQQSHAAQRRTDRCAGRALRWFTTSEELQADADYPGVTRPDQSTAYHRGYHAGYAAKRRGPPKAVDARREDP